MVTGVDRGRYQFRRLRRRFRTPLRTGSGTVECVDRILLRVEAESGVGFGEIAPWPGFPVETADTAAAALREAGSDLGRLRSLVRTRSSTLPCLAAGLSMAERWNEFARFAGALPCAALLASGGTDAAERIREGYRTLKLKIGPEDAPSLLISLLAQLPETTRLRIDANGSLRLERAREWVALARSDPRIEFIEQPLPPDHAGYVSLGPTKVALDESMAQPATSRDAARWEGDIVIKPALGGDWHALANWASSRRERIIPSSAFETAVGRQASLALAHTLGTGRDGGFDTLGRFESDGRDLHRPGPLACGRDDIDWEAFWDSAA